MTRPPARHRADLDGPDMEKPYDIYDYEVLDRNGRRMGPITGYWVDEATGRPEFASVKTGWLFGKQHLIPIRDAYFDYGGKRLRVPYDEAFVKDAPGFDPDHALTPAEEDRVYGFYHLGRSLSGSPTGLPEGQAGPEREMAPERTTEETAEIPLREERVDVGKREVETGEVRLRKVVRTETVNVPVDLTRERINIERLTPDELQGTFSGRRWDEAFREDEISMTERREEPVVEKHSEVVGGVRATKEIDTERRDISADVRREDVEIDREDVERDLPPGGP